MVMPSNPSPEGPGDLIDGEGGDGWRLSLLPNWMRHHIAPFSAGFRATVLEEARAALNAAQPANRTPDTSPSPEGLRPADCPFCAHHLAGGFWFSGLPSGDYRVTCFNCGAESPPRDTIDDAVEAWNRRAPAQPEPSPEWREAARIQEVIAEGDGVWLSCSGCLELEDGQNVHGYPFSKALGCVLGGGCGECGGIGAIWDTTDYAAMGDEIARLAPPPAPDPVGLVGKEENSPSRRQEHGDQSSLRSLATETQAGPGDVAFLWSERTKLLDERDQAQIALRSARAWIMHWRQDVEAGLKPTTYSLAGALADLERAIPAKSNASSPSKASAGNSGLDEPSSPSPTEREG